MIYTNELKTACRALYIRGLKPLEIEAETGVKIRSIYDWAKEGGWDTTKATLTADQIVAQRICVLVERENKTQADIKEFESLCRIAASFEQNSAKTKKIEAEAERISAEAQCIRERGHTPQLSSSSGGGNGSGKNGSKKKAQRNDVTDIDVSVFGVLANSMMFLYQLLWRNNKHQRNRFILKARQIGATFYFAFEAFEDAVLNGENQIFLSASKAQAKVFKGYIVALALEHFDLELKGSDTIELYKEGKLHATLYFLSTNANTAQSYHGHLYLDEVFWIPSYEKLEKVAKGMASHKKWRRTYFSVPSSIQHPAYRHWSGERFNKGKKDKASFTYTNEQLLEGVLGADKVWRCQVTVVDAQNMGCDLFDIQELRDENTKEDFDNLFMCKFIDDAMSVFPFSEMQVCIVDRAAWVHVKDGPRPLGNRPAALGYDPSRLRDNAALTLLEMPLTHQGKWRLIEKQQFVGQSSEFQANRIREYLDRYNIVHIGIDITGIGYGVFEQIEDIHQVMPIYYSLETKTRLVMNGKRIIQAGRFQYDAADTAITQSFMQITQQTTRGGHITYGANRNAETGHADLAWSVMHAFYAERVGQESSNSVITAFSN